LFWFEQPFFRTLRSQRLGGEFSESLVAAFAALGSFAVKYSSLWLQLLPPQVLYGNSIL
jgi:hypothetical protein